MEQSSVIGALVVVLDVGVSGVRSDLVSCPAGNENRSDQGRIEPPKALGLMRVSVKPGLWTGLD